MVRRLRYTLLALLTLVAFAPVHAADPELDAVLERLRAAERAEHSAREDLHSRVAEGSLTGDARADYERYVSGLQVKAAALRAEAARLQGLPFASGPGAVLGAEAPESADQKVSRLDASLHKSLGDFDEMLLREREQLARRREATGGGASGGGASGGAGGGQGASQAWGERSGSESESGGESQSGGEGMQASAGAQGGQGGLAAEGREGTGGTPATGQQGSSGDMAGGRGEGTLARSTSTGPAGGANTRGTPADIPDGRDDDVVARQLREAAERETDPALREKLWDEYRRYKAGSR